MFQAPHLRATLLSLLMLPGAFAGDRPLANVPLAWKPTGTLTESVGTLNLLPFAKTRIALLPFTDNRKDKALIGENLEDAAPRLVTTKDEVAGFLADRLQSLLKATGLPLTDQPAEATTTVAIEVLAFKVTEHNTYRGEVSLLVSVRAGNQELWRGTLLGHATRWGRSYRLENYHEALCDSFLDAVANGLKNDPFLKALAGQPLAP